jgi:very-short-patch-repair endonuclease
MKIHKKVANEFADLMCSACHQTLMNSRRVISVHAKQCLGGVEVKKRVLTCHFCGKECERWEYLDEHIQSVHVHTSHQSFVCDGCGLELPKKTSLTSHMSTCTEYMKWREAHPEIVKERTKKRRQKETRRYVKARYECRMSYLKTHQNVFEEDCIADVIRSHPSYTSKINLRRCASVGKEIVVPLAFYSRRIALEIDSSSQNVYNEFVAAHKREQRLLELGWRVIFVSFLTFVFQTEEAVEAIYTLVEDSTWAGKKVVSI